MRRSENCVKIKYLDSEITWHQSPGSSAVL